MLSMLGVAGIGIMNSQPCAMDDCSGLLSSNDKWENLWLILPLFLTLYRLFENTINHHLVLLFVKLKLVDAPNHKHIKGKNHANQESAQSTAPADGSKQSSSVTQQLPPIKMSSDVSQSSH